MAPAKNKLSAKALDYYEELALDWLEKIDSAETPHSSEEWDKHDAHAIKRGRFSACPIMLYESKETGEDNWGAVIDGDQVEDLDQGDIVDLQVVTRSGKTWPAQHEVFCIVEGVAFAKSNRSS